MYYAFTKFIKFLYPLRIDSYDTYLSNWIRIELIDIDFFFLTFIIGHDLMGKFNAR